MLDEMIFECRRYDYNVVATAIEKSGNGAQSAMEDASLRTRSDRSQRFGPQISHFENKWHTLAPCQPPPGEGNQQLRRSANDYIRPCHTESTDRRRQPERTIVADALMRFAIWQWPKPRSHDPYSINDFSVDEATQSGPPF
jgi:hypothetical protein